VGAQRHREFPVAHIDYLITAPEAAERLGCTDKMIRKMARDGRLPYVKVGALLRFRPVDVESFIEANLMVAAP
jgi:excisionase family DNA binding protein